MWLLVLAIGKMFLRLLRLKYLLKPQHRSLHDSELRQERSVMSDWES